MIRRISNSLFNRKSKETSEQNNDETYELNTFIKVVSQLRVMSNELNDKTKSLVCARVEMITEYTIWGDKNDDDFWDFFCEQDILTLLLSIMKRTQSKELVIVIIQSLAILLSNTQKQENINYLLSHTRLNEFIVYYYNFNDEEIVDYYVSLLKSITIRLNTQNLNLFYNQRLCYFPLLWQAQKFFNHPEQMVRTAVRTVVLGAMKLKPNDPYWNRFPFVIFYVHYSCYIREHWLQLLSHESLADATEDQCDSMMFLADVYDNCSNCQSTLDHALVVYALLPTIFSGFMLGKKFNVQIPLALYLLTKLIGYLETSQIPDFIVYILFSPRIPKVLLDALQSRPPTPQSYISKWSFKNFWDSNFDLILQFSDQLFDENKKISLTDPSQLAVHEYQKLQNNLQLSNEQGIVNHYFGDDEQLTEDNPLLPTIIHLLTTKDDRLLYLTLKLIEKIIESKSITVLDKFGLKKGSRQLILTYPNLILQLIKVVQVDPPLRLCSLIQTVKVLLLLLRDQDNKIELNEEETFALVEEDIDFIYRVPIRPQELAQRDLAVYFIMRQLMNQPQEDIVPHNQTNDWVIGRKYDIDRRILPCTIIQQTINERLQSCNSGPWYILIQQIQSYLIEDQENFLIVSPDITQQEWAQLLHKFKLEHMEFIVDHVEPRVLIAAFAFKKQFFDMKLYFDDVSLALEAKKMLEERRQSHKESLRSGLVGLFKRSEEYALGLIQQSKVDYRQQQQQDDDDEGEMLEMSSNFKYQQD